VSAPGRAPGSGPGGRSAGARPPRRRIPWDRITAAMAAHLAGHGSPGLPSVSAVARESPDPFRVLVSTMISLRTKDDVTTRASRALFAAAPSPAALAALPTARIEKLIFPAGFYHTKARALRDTARLLLERHEGVVPRDMDALLALPGVGRKTANLVLSLGFGIDAICVDTHVHRISNRMGWVSTRTPAETEQALMTVLPRRHWISINELLVRWGQTVCAPLSPWCSRCPVRRSCAREGVGRSR
jgi:endonuclease III